MAYRALVWGAQTVDPKREHIPEARPGVSTVIAPFGVSGIWFGAETPDRAPFPDPELTSRRLRLARSGCLQSSTPMRTLTRILILILILILIPILIRMRKLIRILLLLGSATNCGAAAKLRYHDQRTSSQAPPPTAGQQPGSATNCGPAARLSHQLRASSQAPLRTAGQQPGSATNCGPPARLTTHTRIVQSHSATTHDNTQASTSSRRTRVTSTSTVNPQSKAQELITDHITPHKRIASPSLPGLCIE